MRFMYRGPKKHSLLAFGFAIALFVVCPFAAWAETLEGAGASPEASSGQLPAALQGETDIEKLTISFKAANGELQLAEARVAEIQLDIDAIQAVLPAQQARSDAGMKQRYIMQANPMVFMDSLLESETLGDFMRQTEYLERITQSNLDELNRTRDMKQRLDADMAEQERVRAEAQTHLEEAQSALKAEQDERAKKQAEGIADAMDEAGRPDPEESEDDEDDAEKKEVDKDDDAEDADDEKDADEDKNKEDKKTPRVTSTSDTGPINDGANWYADRDEFLAEWSARLDQYLEGTALEGQGINFAASAWKYCIDPRWSAAISKIESGNGAVCIRPHNAWGWGAADSNPYGLAKEWESWEEAIEAHTKGLEKGYGYTITKSGAQKYCPYNWQEWYNITLNEMAKI